MALLPVFGPIAETLADPRSLNVDADALADYLVWFLKEEVVQQRGIRKAVVGLSGGVDSAVTTYLCARAFGPENTHVFMMPYRLSAASSLDHAQLVVDDLGLQARTIDITPMVEGYTSHHEQDASAHRIGNICSRCRMIILFDQSAKLGGLPIGTGNKTERMFGYYTWHGDDAPPINPLGDLWKSQVWQLAEALNVPQVITEKAPSADLVPSQTDEGDLGISYARADLIMNALLRDYPSHLLAEVGFHQDEIALVQRKIAGTHWKRKLPTVAMISDSAINEYYLRPVDYR